MTKDLCFKLKKLADSPEIDSSDGVSNSGLKEFILLICDDSSFPDDIGECLYESFDRINDKIVPLFRTIYSSKKSYEWYKWIIFLFDESIDLEDCNDIIVKAIISDMSCKEFDNILKESSDQIQFKNNLTFYLENNHGVKGRSIFVEEKISENFIDYLKVENEKLSLENKSLKDDLVDCRSLIDSLSLKNESLTVSYNDLQSEVISLRNESDRLNSTIAFQNIKLSKNKNLVEQLEKQNEKLLGESRGSSRSSGVNYDELISENSSLKELVDNLNAQIVELTDELSITRNALDSLNKFNSDDSNIDAVADDGFLNRDSLPDINSLEFTDSLYEDERMEYSVDDVVPVTDNQSFIKKSCNFFAGLLSKKFENNFLKLPDQEQNYLIFAKLMEGDYSQDIVSLVSNSINKFKDSLKLDLHRMLSNKCDSNDIIRFCNNAA